MLPYRLGCCGAQDKTALEEKVKELQALIETVQNQRNELRQAFKVLLCLALIQLSSLYLFPTPLAFDLK